MFLRVGHFCFGRSNMNTDIRISVSFKGHRKRKKLKLYLKDDGATEYLIDLWISVATDRRSEEHTSELQSR